MVTGVVECQSPALAAGQLVLRHRYSALSPRSGSPAAV